MEAVCIFGPPGTGKTESLVREARTLLEQGNKLKFLSHTKAGAEECGARIGNREIASTVHSLCLNLLGLGGKNVVTTAKLQVFAETVGVPMRREDEGEMLEGDEYLGCYERARVRGQHPKESWDATGRPGTWSSYDRFLKSYDEWKKTYGWVDFTDMLTRATATSLKVDFNILLVDEAQDLSPLQWQVVTKIAPQVQRVYVAGDDDQAIYEWGGADPHGMDNFGNSHNARRVVLDQSHRVPRELFRIAQAIIHRVSRRVSKNYAPRPERGRMLYNSGLEMAQWPRGTKEEPVMVLCRDWYKAKDVQRALMRAGIPFKTAGKSGLSATPYARAMVVLAKLQRDMPITENERQTLYKACDERGKQYVAENDYVSLLRRPYYASIRMPDFAIDYFSACDPLSPTTYTVGTIHGAKGREAGTVVLYLPSSQRVLDTYENSPDQEHRLMYVAVTRAKNDLHVIDGSGAYPLLSQAGW